MEGDVLGVLAVGDLGDPADDGKVFVFGLQVGIHALQIRRPALLVAELHRQTRLIRWFRRMR